MAASQHYSIKFDDITLHYTKQGSGDPLLLLHGWLQTSAFWEPYVKSLADDYEVYSIDLRGHGRTSVLTEKFSITEASTDIRAMIRALKLERVKAIGLSYGGLVLLGAAAADTGLIDKMVLIGVSNRYNGSENQSGKQVFRFDDMDAGFRGILLEQHPFGEEQIRALFNPNINYQIDIGDEQLREIKTSVLIVNGDSDEIVGINGAFNIFKNVPDAFLWILPGTGHLAIGEHNREDFIEKTRSFFSGW
ncbi:MAG: alpha/beta hydrolase [Cyclobacteriaceae bacterium]|nr:alpha/beta hydrolase [Cyclobacteriaceae bacterium]